MSFKMEDIKIGYMVEVTVIGDEYIKYLCTVTMWNGHKILTNGIHWFKLSDFDDNMKSTFNKITKVWGYPKYAKNMWYNNTAFKPLLWERPSAKKMTKAEIEEILGYEIEIVEQGE